MYFHATVYFTVPLYFSKSTVFFNVVAGGLPKGVRH
jgi:hypothetical protein